VCSVEFLLHLCELFLEVGPSSFHVAVELRSRLTQVFAGLKTVSYKPDETYSSFVQIKLPACDCVTLRCEGADLDEAYELIPGYLADNGLTQKGEIVDKETMGGTHVLYIPV